MERMRAVLPSMLIVLACGSWPALAQDRPVVFVHGFASAGATWAGAAARLAETLALSPITPTISSAEPYQTQAIELQRQVADRGDDLVAVGHSNGGLVARELTRRRGVGGVFTMGTPHRGAPVIANFYDYFGFNQALIGSFSNVYRLFGQGCCNWQWILSLYHNVWQAVISASINAVPRVAGLVGLNATLPVTAEMRPGSSFLVGLNSPENLAREAAGTPVRVGIVSTAHNFYYGGVLRAAFPDEGDTLYYVRELARVGLESYAAYLYAHAPFNDWWAFDIANGMMTAAFYLRYMDDVWCRTVSMVGFGECWANDTIVPAWSQVYPGGGFIDTGWEGPAHLQQTRMSDALLEQALTLYGGIPRRSALPPPVPPPGPPGNEPPNPLPADALFYEHTGFAGGTLSLAASQSYIGSGWNDRVSSVHVPPGRTVVLYEHADYGGASLTLDGDAADLRDYPGPGIDGTWNDAASAVEIR